MDLLTPLKVAMYTGMNEFRITGNVLPTFHIFRGDEDVDILRPDRKIGHDDIVIMKQRVVNIIKELDDVCLLLFVEKTSIDHKNQIILGQAISYNDKLSLVIPINDSIILDTPDKIDFHDIILDDVFMTSYEV